MDLCFASDYSPTKNLIDEISHVTPNSPFNPLLVRQLLSEWEKTMYISGCPRSLDLG